MPSKREIERTLKLGNYGIWEPTPERFISCHEEILRLKRVGDLEKLAQYENENLVLNKMEFNIG